MAVSRQDRTYKVTPSQHVFCPGYSSAAFDSTGRGMHLKEKYGWGYLCICPVTTIPYLVFGLQPSTFWEVLLQTNRLQTGYGKSLCNCQAVHDELALGTPGYKASGY